LALALVFAANAPAATGPEPGNKDPVGPPASYTILRGDDLAIDPHDEDPNVLNSVQTFPDGNLDSNSIKDERGLGVSWDTGGTVMAAGRIFSQDNDQLINVGRASPFDDPSLLGVESPSGDPTQTYYLHDLHTRIPNTPDLISVAVGDLDKIADKNGVNHDEVVLAYAQGAPPGNLKVNLTVLNYTSM